MTSDKEHEKWERESAALEALYERMISELEVLRGAMETRDWRAIEGRAQGLQNLARAFEQVARNRLTEDRGPK